MRKGIIFFSFSNSEFGREWGVQGETLTFRRKLQKQKERVTEFKENNVFCTKCKEKKILKSEHYQRKVGGIHV